MNITFLVGNGFDKGAGFPTSYKDFYEDFLGGAKTKKLGERLILQSIKKDCDGSRKYWADFEKGLGEFSKCFELSAFEKTLRDNGEMCSAEEHNPTEVFFEGSSYAEDCISKYLQNIENEYMKKKSLSAQGIKGMARWIGWLPSWFGDDNDSGISIRQQYEDCKDEDWVINFISFNYTGLLDRSIGEFAQLQSLKHPYSEACQYAINTNVLHVHGSFDGGKPPVMGVGDVSQISGASFQNPKFAQRLVKNEIVNKARMDWYRSGEKMIQDSRIICVFGLSLGETDMFWWDKIIDWLAGDTRNQLVLFSFTDKPFKENLDTKNTISGDVLESFCKYAKHRVIDELRVHVSLFNSIVNKNWFVDK